MIERLLYAFRQPDVRAHPIRAVWRRVLWRLHHGLRPGEPLILRDWYRGMRIALPRSGCAAQVFYRRYSSAQIVRVMEERLRPGDIVLDVGAHIGEYTLIAAALVGGKGSVYAIEPQPRAAEVIALNAGLNGFQTIHVRNVALADRAGTALFCWDARSWGGWLASGGRQPVHCTTTQPVQCTTLDDFVDREGISRVHFIKLDGAGNERAVLRGGKRLLTSCEAPALICKLYHPEVVRERFGYEAREVLELLDSWGYEVRALTVRGEKLISLRRCYDLFAKGTYGVAVLARRRGRA